MEGFNIFYLGEMKLSEYFQQQKSQAMTYHMKSQLFSRIQKEKQVWIEISTKIPSKLFFFVSRKFLYTSLAAILVVVVFWWLLLDRSDINNFWLFSIQRHTNPWSVLADYVAEIIEFNWEYSLERDWGWWYCFFIRMNKSCIYINWWYTSKNRVTCRVFYC